MDPAVLAGLDLTKTPALLPPNPPPAGYAGLGTGPQLHTTTVVMFAILAPIAILSVALRFHVSLRKPSGRISAADWCGLGALLLTLTQESIILTMGDYQRHQWDISIAKMMDPLFFKKTYVQYVIAWPAISLAKLSILLLYLQLFRVNNTLRWAIVGGIVLTCIAYLPNIGVSSYYCAAHPGEQWDYNIGIRCGNKGALKWLIASATLSLVLDLYILVLPIPQIISLNMSLRRRLGVCIIFFTAAFACICALLTLIYRVHLANASDPLWPGAQLWVTNLTENFIAIIVGSVPGISSWYKKIFMKSSVYSKLSSSFGSTARSTVSKSQGSASANTKYEKKGKRDQYPLTGYSEFDLESQRSLARSQKEVTQTESRV